jgi:hypothetical protein
MAQGEEREKVKVIIAGGRKINDYATLKRAIKDSGFEITEVVSGGAFGVDSMGERYAGDNALPLEVFSARWDIHGPAAGPIRNKQMAEYADALILIWDGASKVSKSMLKFAKENNLKIFNVVLGVTNGS